MRIRRYQKKEAVARFYESYKEVDEVLTRMYFFRNPVFMDIVRPFFRQPLLFNHIVA